MQVAGKHRAGIHCRTSLREGFIKRYFRGAKGDTDLPLDAKEQWSARLAWTAVALPVGSLLLAAGCGHSAPSHARVSGSVHVDGRPISGAVITFEPIEQTGGPKASAVILDGRYTIESASRLHGGRYLVRISMLPGELLTEIHSRVNDAFPPPGAEIASNYDSDSNLRCNLSIDQTNELDFEVRLRP